MRKADYQTLAELIRKEREAMRAALDAATDDKTRAACYCRAQAYVDLARDFARSASVDKPAFLKACGID